MRQKRFSIRVAVSCLVWIPTAFIAVVSAEIRTDSALEVVNIGMVSEYPIVDGEYIVFESDSAHPSEMYVYYHDTLTRATFETGVRGGVSGADIPYIVITTFEGALGEDLNGDNDTDDYINLVHDITSGETVPFDAWGWTTHPCIADGKIAYSVWEQLSGVDCNGDNDLRDECGFYYDITTGQTVNFGHAHGPKIFNNYIIWVYSSEMYYYDINTGDYRDIGFRDAFPGARVVENGRSEMEGSIIAFEVYEGGEGGRDLNGDSDSYDDFSAYYDVSDGTLRIITEIEGGFMEIDNGMILMDTEGSSHRYTIYDIETEVTTGLENLDHTAKYSLNLEGNIIVSNDWDGSIIIGDPPPVGLPNVWIYDVETGEHVNTHIVGFIRNWTCESFNGDILAISTWEANVEEDLNGDSDTWDMVLRYIVEKTNESQHCLCRSDAVSLSPFDPPKSEIFLLEPGGDGITLNPDASHAQVPYKCDFQPGMPDPEPVLEADGAPLSFYQVSGVPRGPLILRKDPDRRTVLFFY